MLHTWEQFLPPFRVKSVIILLLNGLIKDLLCPICVPFNLCPIARERDRNHFISIRKPLPRPCQEQPSGRTHADLFSRAKT